MTVSYQELARAWRDRQPANRANAGVVLIWEDEVYGWKNALRNAECERPGGIAVDVDGNLFIAEGGNDQDGAVCWVVKTS